MKLNAPGIGWTLTAGLALGMASSRLHADPPRYTIIDLGPVAPGVPDASSNADCINNLGQVAGVSTRVEGEGTATLWLQEPAYGLPAGPNDLGDLGGGPGRFYDINDLGQGVGFVGEPGGAGWNMAHIWDPVEGNSPLGTLGGNYSNAQGINNNGWVVGYSDTGVPNTAFQPFLHDGNEMIYLGSFGNDFYGKAHDINDLNQAVGFSMYLDFPDQPDNGRLHAFLWLPEPAYGLPAGLNDIDDFTTELFQKSTAEGINNKGQVVGWLDWLNAFDQSVVQVGLWLPEPDYGLPAGWSDLRGINGIRGTAFAHDINERGEIAAMCDIDPNDPFCCWIAALWRQGEWFDLNECIPIEDQPYWWLESATDINDRGEIAGRGWYMGQGRGFLLVPSVDDSTPPCPGDFNGDGAVAVNDFLDLLAAWGGSDPTYDIAPPGGDGTVDVLDFLALLAAWGPCPEPPTGACCFPITGDCDVLTEADCTFMGGVWQPGETCETFSCPQPLTGACCYYPIVDCEELNAFQCDIFGGTWHGAGSACEGVTCPVPPQGDHMQDPFIIAAVPFSDVGDSWSFDNWYDEQCTFHSDSPDVVYAYTPAQDEVINISTCVNSAYDTKLFVYENAEGNVVACNDDWCSTPSYPDPYVAHIEALPVFAGNTYYIIVDGWGGWGGVYTLDIETVTSGACCLPDGTCANSSEDWCLSQNGEWFEGETCADFTCPPLPLGACCLPGGACLAWQTEWDCEVLNGGVWQGEGVSCFDITCPP
ncbi:MAG: hypothetical protein ACYTE6_02940 [Planctomycetota bacterium]|jgi:probable HAF family extracellular repeat protein